jgi:hypothetical protein
MVEILSGDIQRLLEKLMVHTSGVSQIGSDQMNVKTENPLFFLSANSVQ